MRSTLECFVASTTRPTSDDCKSNGRYWYRKPEHADKASCRAAQSAPIATTNMHHVIIIVQIDLTETIQNHSRKFICSDIVHSNHLKPFLLRTDQFCSSIKPYQSIKKHWIVLFHIKIIQYLFNSLDRLPFAIFFHTPINDHQSSRNDQSNNSINANEYR